MDKKKIIFIICALVAVVLVTVLIVGMRSGTAPDDAGKVMNLILPKPIDTARLCRRLYTWLCDEQNG